MLELNKIYNMDCIDGLKKVPSHTIDMIITDPPYSTPVITAFGRKKEKNIGDISIQKNFFILLREQFKRILKEQKPVFIFCDSKYYPILFEVFYKWNTNQLLVWDKKRIGLGSPFRKQFELIYFVSPDYGLHFNNGHWLSDILNCKVVPSEQRLIGSQKPKQLVRTLIESFTDNDDTILDCFMGSGTTAVVCKELGRNFIGFEINKEYYDVSLKRLLNVPNRLEAFTI